MSRHAFEPPLAVAPEIEDALESGKPVVALESTIIAHGMPRPRNLEVARSLDRLIRDHGAVPAMIAVAEGSIRVGVRDEILERLAGDEAVAKVSRADLPACLISGALGATTVAATMIGAHLAGIRIFATGGVGGAHRGAEQSFDISADLLELARTPVAVVSAGAKSILDLPKTLEILETHGVPVIGYRTDTFPAFFVRSSGLPLPVRVDDVARLAAMLETQWSMGLASGALIANPIPQDAAIDAAEIGIALDQALEEARRHGITGKPVTPFLLARLNELTGGRSLDANIALVYNNAKLGAELAKALSALS